MFNAIRENKILTNFLEFTVTHIISLQVFCLQPLSNTRTKKKSPAHQPNEIEEFMASTQHHDIRV